MLRPYFVVLTGPPGGGKSTIIKYLASKGYLVLPESYRWMRVFQTIESQYDSLLKMTVFPSAKADSQLAFELFRADTDPEVENSFVFMDRSIIDFMAYCSFYSSPFLATVKSYAHEYADLILVAFYIEGRLPDYRKDWLRHETFTESLSIGEAICKAYKDCSIPLIHLPSQSTEIAATTILKHLSDMKENTA